MLTPVSLQSLLDVMKLMAATENLIADFYRTCADVWKEDREFWTAIVKEEEKHAKNIARMCQLVASKPEQFQLGRPFNAMAIRTIKTGVEKHMQSVRQEQITRDRAILVARDIESSLMERHYDQIVRTADVEYLTLMKQITDETRSHIHRIEQRIRKLT